MRHLRLRPVALVLLAVFIPSFRAFADAAPKAKHAATTAAHRAHVKAIAGIGAPQEVANIRSGSASSNPASFASVGCEVYFAANDGGTSGHFGRELWKSDGTNVGTVRVSDIAPGTASSSPMDLTTFGTSVVFTADPGTGKKPYITDGTTVTQLSSTALVPSNPMYTPSGSHVFFIADGGAGIELWVTDGTPGGTSQVADIYGSGSSNPKALMAFNNGVLFWASPDGGTTYQPYFGTATGVTQLATLTTATFPSFAVNGSLGYFVGGTVPNGKELYSTDGTLAGTTLIDINPGPTDSNPVNLTPFLNGILLGANGGQGRELWFSNGQTGASNTYLVDDIMPGSGGSGSSISDFAVLGSIAVFGANDGLVGKELWVTDGVQCPGVPNPCPGTHLLADLNSGPGDSTPIFFARTGNMAYYTAFDGVGTDLFATDGTNVVSQGAEADGLSNFRKPAVLGDRLFFEADNSNDAGAPEIWVVDGTSNSATQVTNGGTLTLATSGNDLLFPDCGTVYFAAANGDGFELWDLAGCNTGIVVTNPVNNAATQGQPFDETFTVTGNNGAGTGPWSISGTLPSGITFDTATGELSGTTNDTATSYPLTITYTDSNGCTGSSDYTLIVNNAPPPDLTVTKADSGDFTQGGTGSTYTITVSNAAGRAATDGTNPVTVADTLPTGLILTGASGTGWDCSASAGPTVNCSSLDVVAGGASFNPITVTFVVANDAPSPVDNTASVSYQPEQGYDTGNNSGNDSTTVATSGNCPTFNSHNEPVSSTTYQVVTGDFNKDGIQDIAVTNQSGAVSILLGNGSGGIGDGTFATAVDYSVDGFLTALAVGDFNGDTWPDIAVATYSSGIYFLINNQDGTFTLSGTNLTTDINTPYALTVGKFNQNNNSYDGVAVSNNGGNNVTVYLGNNNVTFTEATGSPFAVGNLPVGIATGNFNGDTNPDLAIANSGSSDVSVFTGNGDGTFTQVANSPFSAGSSPWWVAVDDFNGDLFSDIAVTNLNSNDVTILIGDNAGNFTPATGSPFPVGAGPYGIATGDFNSDGKRDLVVANQLSVPPGDNDVAILLGNGDGSFGAPSFFTSGISDPRSVAVADFNGNGQSDVVVADHGDTAVTIMLDTCPIPPDLTITKTHVGNFTQGDTGDTYTITVTNSGGSSTDGSTVTVTDTLPAGLTPTGPNGANGDWNCTIVTQTLTCTTTNVLAASASYSAISLTVDVASDATSTSNTATVSGGGETNTTNDSATDATTINVLPPDLTITKTHSGNFTQGDTGDTYTITVTNSGTGPTDGSTVTVTDTLPTGLTPTGPNGTTGDWSCAIVTQTLTCTTSNVLAPSASYSAISLTVNVAADATNTTNTATVAGGGESNTSNDSSDDPTTIVAPTPLTPNLTISKTHTGNFTQGQTGATYSIVVTNSGTGPTSGTVTVTDTLPAGLTPTGPTGSTGDWSCNIVTQTLTCTTSNVLAASSSYSTITLTVNVDANAPANVNNTATVSGGGETDTADDSSTDATTITPINAPIPTMNEWALLALAGFLALLGAAKLRS